MTQELADLFRLTLPVSFKKQAHTAAPLQWAPLAHSCYSECQSANELGMQRESPPL